MSTSNLATNIINLHRDCILLWKLEGVKLVNEQFLHLVEENHAFNYKLWHAEDRARRDDLGHEFVYHAKREIDSHNQRRNNCMEAMDEWLFQTLKPANSGTCPVHSESPGMMIDRLSILSLKSYHMALQISRQDVDKAHQQNCLLKWRSIEAQKNQLHDCLRDLLEEVKHKTRTFRVYHQFKMYNDVSLNPELVSQAKSAG